jgi:NTP pyrophosphatase (non-canonical NTP hydrolase)
VADPVKAAVLMEECGEVARAVLDIADVRSELVQVAAVAIAWLEGLS